MGDTNEPIKHPAWKNALDQMRERGLSYGASFTTAELCEWMRCEKSSLQFVFGMIEIRTRIERDDGYYMARAEGGLAWRIIESASHENVAQKFDQKVTRYAVRSVHIRSATLTNPTASLSEGARSQIERNLQHASMRLALISRRHKHLPQ